MWYSRAGGHVRADQGRRARSRRGLILVGSLGLVVILSILGSALLLRGLHEHQMSQQSYAFNRALFYAEASLDTAIDQLRAGNGANLSATAFGDGRYWAEISQPGSFDYLVTGHGQQTGSQRNLEARMRLTPMSVFQFALFGNSSLTVEGSAITNSYNSAQGLYDPQTAGSNGDVGTNATTPGGVTINGSIAINGQVVVGPDVADPSSVVVVTGGSALITGNPPVVSLSQTMSLPAVTVPQGLTCTPLSIAGQTTTTLSSAVGTYCFTDVKLTGGATLTADGPVKIYVTGEFSATGDTTIGIPASPPSMLILMASNEQVTIESNLTGSTQFYGGLYAPTATIDISGNAEVFGSVIARRVDVSGSANVHYDEAMGTLTQPTGLYQVRVRSWREL
ncbi:MAG: hypothetical protein HYZ92_06165 [Candidatus Omnitrophica bacterium]|nr:hypothetical protein [Candidatus Omnitrophota bacterium]